MNMDKRLLTKEEFDEYYNMDIDELYKINTDDKPYYLGELIMILINPHDESYEELKRIYCGTE